MDELRQVVFEEALALGLEEGDGLLVVGRVGGGEAEIDLLAALVERHALKAEGDGAVLHRRERLGIEDLQLDLAAGCGLVFLEHLAHALRIDGIARDLVAQSRRIVEAHHDRLVELLERVARAFGERVEMLLRQVDPRRAQRLVGDRVERHEQHGGKTEGDERAGAAGDLHLNPPSSLRRRPRWRTGRA